MGLFCTKNKQENDTRRVCNTKEIIHDMMEDKWENCNLFMTANPDSMYGMIFYKRDSYMNHPGYIKRVGSSDYVEKGQFDKMLMELGEPVMVIKSGRSGYSGETKFDGHDICVFYVKGSIIILSEAYRPVTDGTKYKVITVDSQWDAPSVGEILIHTSSPILYSRFLIDDNRKGGIIHAKEGLRYKHGVYNGEEFVATGTKTFKDDQEGYKFIENLIRKLWSDEPNAVDC